MEWKELEKMTVVKLREEALKHPEIKGVRGKNKQELIDELARVLGIEKPHFHAVATEFRAKPDIRKRIRELKVKRDGLLESHNRVEFRGVRREIHRLKHQLRKIQVQADGQS